MLFFVNDRGDNARVHSTSSHKSRVEHTGNAQPRFTPRTEGNVVTHMETLLRISSEYGKWTVAHTNIVN